MKSKQNLYESHTCQTLDRGLIADIHAPLTARIKVRRRHEMVELEQEIWRQDAIDPDLWHGASGLMLNSDALAERAEYFETIKLTATQSAVDVQDVFYA